MTTTDLPLNVTDHLSEFIENVTDAGVSDIAFSPNQAPHARLNGEWTCYPDYHRLTERNLYDIILQTHPQYRDDQPVRDDLGKHGKLSYATVISAWNYRVQVGLTQGEPFLILRPIGRVIPTVDELDLLPPPQRVDGTTGIALEATLRNIVTNSRGLVIVTGATGSGKSTTLAAMIRHFNDTRPGHIITIEDPIEFVHQKNKSLIHQRMVGPGNDVPTFDAGVEDALRQAPDIILIGEVRDKHTMTAALAAAETGHLVFCTLHTRDAPSTIQRVLGFYGPGEKESIRSQFANTLVAVISQQLVPRTRPTPHGGRMRQLIMEILQPDTGMRSAMRDPDKPLQNIRDQQKVTGDLGNVIMDDELFRAARLGLVEPEVALSRSIKRDTFEERLKNERIGRGA